MPSILIVGATGNTGAEAVRTLPSLLNENPALKSHRIIALTRNANGSVAKELAAIDGVEVLEQNWVTIDDSWLKAHQVERIYIASHNTVTHFNDESLFLQQALLAGVQYVVRMSTTNINVKPVTHVFYGRAHWAIEKLLEQPEFKALKWTSLQPNIFTMVALGGAVDWVKNYKEKGEQPKLRLMIAGDQGVGLIDPSEIGIQIAHLLASEDPEKHNGKRYIIAGPSDITGEQVVDLVEKYAGIRPEPVFRDASLLDYLTSDGYPPQVIKSFKRAVSTIPANSETSVEKTPTSPELKELYAPRNHALQQLEDALKAL